MGRTIDPARLTGSGEICVVRITELASLRLPAPQLITAVGTVIEGHVSRILNHLATYHGRELDTFGKALLGEQKRSLDGTWESRKKWLKFGFGVGYADLGSFQAFHTLIDARNAIVHGDGSLTSQQRRSMKVSQLANLEKILRSQLDVLLSRELHYGERSAEKVALLARRFVSEFDELALEKHPCVAGDIEHSG